MVKAISLIQHNLVFQIHHFPKYIFLPLMSMKLNNNILPPLHLYSNHYKKPTPDLLLPLILSMDQTLINEALLLPQLRSFHLHFSLHNCPYPITIYHYNPKQITLSSFIMIRVVILQLLKHLQYLSMPDYNSLHMIFIILSFQFKQLQPDIPRLGVHTQLLLIHYLVFHFSLDPIHKQCL